MVGVPQAAEVKYVELGGLAVTRVQGAVPNDPENGDVVAVPPEITSLDPAPDPPGSTQVVVNTSCVPVPAVLALTAMYCPVYGDVSAYCR